MSDNSSVTNMESAFHPLPVYLMAWEGSRAKNRITAGSEVVHEIAGVIPAGKMVILSLSSVPDGNGCILRLINSATGTEVSSQYGLYTSGWFSLSRMTYFRITEAAKYNIKVISTSYSGGYTINVKAADLAEFVKLDTRELPAAENAKTYCISNSPEILNANEHKGEWGYYLQRSRINGNANIYWEHVTQYDYDMMFGVLLWNTGGTVLSVRLNTRSFWSLADDAFYSDRLSAMNRVWIDWFSSIRYSDFSGFNTVMRIAPGEARWICLYGVDKSTIFNGVLDISVEDSEGLSYTGEELFCDTYIMSIWTNDEGNTMTEETRRNVGHAARAGGGTQLLRGSGNGAILSARFAPVEITQNNPFSLVLTGFDAPYVNSGELVPVSDIVPGDGGTNITGGTLPNCFNYGVIYKLDFDSFTSSSGQVAASVRYNAKSNPNAAASNDGGIYATVCSEYLSRYSGSPVFSTVLLNNGGPGTSSEAPLPGYVPLGRNVSYYVVVSGMSSLPVEISFENVKRL